MNPTAKENLAGEKGFEPLHAGIKIQCLNQLGDSPTQVNDAIETTSSTLNRRPEDLPVNKRVRR
jgi:hypothetical protein